MKKIYKGTTQDSLLCVFGGGQNLDWGGGVPRFGTTLLWVLAKNSEKNSMYLINVHVKSALKKSILNINIYLICTSYRSFFNFGVEAPRFGHSQEVEVPGNGLMPEKTRHQIWLVWNPKSSTLTMAFEQSLITRKQILCYIHVRTRSQRLGGRTYCQFGGSLQRWEWVVLALL